jgi:putative type II/III system pilus formation protein
LQKNGILVVTGKSYGVTNLIALDNAGSMLAESLIRVQAPSESLVTVQRGLERESYSCTPNCQPSILLGDSNKYFSEVGGQAGQRNTLATQR